MRRTNSLEKTLLLRKIEGKRRRGRQRIRWLDHQLNEHEFEQTQRESDRQRSLVGYSPWDGKESDTTEQLTHTHTHTHTHTLTHSHRHTHRHTHTQTHPHRHTHTDTLTHRHSHMLTHSHMRTHRYTHAYTLVHMRTHGS